MRSIGFMSVAFASLFVAPAAWAQSSGPSASQIIQALRPTSNIAATTRGIVPLGPAGEAPRVMTNGAARVPTAMHIGHAVRTTTNGTPSINLNIDFAMGSATLTPRAITELDRLGHALTDPTLADYKFKVVGHTDTTGSATTNLTLSNARAKAVDDYLQTKFNIAPARLAALGVGQQDLLVPTGPNTAERANRRVQVINIGK
jgi:OOP family OmpA-OmpF porin